MIQPNRIRKHEKFGDFKTSSPVGCW